jgi:FkbM family methyltransferase
MLVKRAVQRFMGSMGYRIVPAERDAYNLRKWLLGRTIGTVVDIGASTGETAKEWLAAYPDATVHAIEPLPDSFAQLKALQPRYGGRLVAHNFAVGAEQRTIDFHFHPAHPTSSSLLRRTDFSSHVLPFTRAEMTIGIEMTTLDFLFADAAAIMKQDVLLKLDVQGAECGVIEGATRFLQSVKFVLTEISLAPVYEGQSDFDTLHEMLRCSGMKLLGFVEQFQVPDSPPIYADLLYINNGTADTKP